MFSGSLSAALYEQLSGEAPDVQGVVISTVSLSKKLQPNLSQSSLEPHIVGKTEDYGEE